MPTGWREERHRRLFIYQRHHAPGSKALLGNVPKLGGGEAVDAFAELTKRLRLSQMQEAAPHADGHVFAILPGESYLTLELLLGNLQLSGREGGVAQASEFLTDQTQATFHILVVATEVGCPQARVGVAGHAALDGIDQSATFAEADVEAGIHAWAAQDVAEQGEAQPAFVGQGIGLATKDDVGLMGVPLRDGLGRRRWALGLLADIRVCHGGFGLTHAAGHAFDLVCLHVAQDEEHHA